MWGLPFLERVTEWRECAADGKWLPLCGVIGVPCTRDVVPEENAARTAPRYLCVGTLLESIFRNATKDASEWGRCFRCDGGISFYALELVPFIRGELQLPAWYQECCTPPLGYSVGCFNPILRGTRKRVCWV